VAKKALSYASDNGHDVIIFDTAGRLHIDEALMKELSDVKQFLNPQEVLFVASAIAREVKGRAIILHGPAGFPLG